jgi:hypothetical protein
VPRLHGIATFPDFLNIAGATVDDRAGNPFQLGGKGRKTTPGRDQGTTVVNDDYLTWISSIDHGPDLELGNAVRSKLCGGLFNGDGATTKRPAADERVQAVDNTIATQLV